jgi:ATP-dependent Clp protease protease subunit
MNVLVDGEIVLFGTVGEGFFEQGFTSLDVVKALAQVGRNKDVTVRLNSGGGIADEGIAIFNAMNSHRGKVTVVVESVAASAASVIAMAGDEVIMKTGAYMMVHDPSGITAGTSDDHAKSVEALETIAESMADIYAEKTGKNPADTRSDMKAEVWMTARDAVAKGYADRTDKSKSKEPTAFDYRLYPKAPERMAALAESRSWKHGGQSADASATTQESEMTDAEKVAADKLAADKAAADAKVKAEAEADAKAKADADAAAALKAKTEGTETMEQITARVRADMAEQHKQIVAACEIAGTPGKAVEFIGAGKSVPEVLAELRTIRAAGGSSATATNEINPHNRGGGGDNVSPFKRHAEAHNSRFAK